MTISEENYIKFIYHLSLVSPKGVNTNAIAGMLDTKASSVTDMLKKLSDKELLANAVDAVDKKYKKYFDRLQKEEFDDKLCGDNHGN